MRSRFALLRYRLALFFAVSIVTCHDAIAAEPYHPRPEVAAFIADVASRHGFDVESLAKLFRAARFEPRVIKAIMPPRDPGIRSWRAYRARYIDADRIERGVRFWQANASALRKAEANYGVPAQIIVAIIGVETIYGRHMGSFSTLSALTTLAFDYPPRADLFRRELEELLLLAREKERSPLSFRGSYAGAIGIPQFLPSSYRQFGVDFDGDGRAELEGSVSDAIGSIGCFLRQHGWKANGSVTVRAKTDGDKHLALANGEVVPRFSRDDLDQHGVTSEQPIPEDEKSALIDLVTPHESTEFWLGFQNFYALTRYNRSSFYAMAVFQLSEALASACQGRCDRE